MQELPLVDPARIEASPPGSTSADESVASVEFDVGWARALRCQVDDSRSCDHIWPNVRALRSAKPADRYVSQPQWDPKNWYSADSIVNSVSPTERIFAVECLL